MTTAASSQHTPTRLTSKNYALRATDGVTRWHSILQGCRESEIISNKVPRVCGVVRPPPKATFDIRHSKERSKQITFKSSAAYCSQFTWVSSWPASLVGLSRNIATTTLRQLIATLDIWMQSGTGVSRKPSESVLFGWFYDVRAERRPGIDPQRSVTGLRFDGRGRGRPENIVIKNRSNFRDFSDVFKFFKFFDIFWSIVDSSFHVIQKFTKKGE